MIADGQTSWTDSEDWRGFCRAAAEDLTLLESDPDGILAATLGEPGFARRRYAQVRRRIELLGAFEASSQVRVLEVGGGYGGQALDIIRAHPSVRYAIVDLPEPFMLQQAFLRSHGYRVDEDRGEPADLFLSSFALSELLRDLQIEHLERASRCPYGFIYWNGWLDVQLTLDETVDRLPEQVVVVPDPDHARNRILTWRPA